jgi:hypothetical protein
MGMRRLVPAQPPGDTANTFMAAGLNVTVSTSLGGGQSNSVRGGPILPTPGTLKELDEYPGRLPCMGP